MSEPVFRDDAPSAYLCVPSAYLGAPSAYLDSPAAYLREMKSQAEAGIWADLGNIMDLVLRTSPASPLSFSLTDRM